MADSVRDAIDAIRGKLQAELDTELAMLAERQAAELESSKAASRAEVERQLAAARAAAEAEAERRVAEVKAASTAELERRAAEIRAAVEADAEHRVAAAKTAALAPGSLAHAFRQIDAAGSIPEILTAIEQAVASVSPRAAVFVGSAAALDRWAGGASASAGEVPAVARVVKTASQSRADGVLIVPLVLEGTPVGAVEAELAEGDASATIEAIVRYGSTRLAAFTAMRTAQAQRWIRTPASSDQATRPAASSEQTISTRGSLTGELGQAAERYARLLVSEIKLYNEAAVREGREHRDLAQRLSAEIARARRTYDERVPATVSDRDRYFHDQLVQILAAGDRSLLG